MIQVVMTRMPKCPVTTTGCRYLPLATTIVPHYTTTLPQKKGMTSIALWSTHTQMTTTRSGSSTMIPSPLQQQQQHSSRTTTNLLSYSSLPSLFRTTGTSSPSSFSSSSYRSYSRTATPYRATTEYPPHTIFPMPALSPTMETGSIAAWTIQVGDSFRAGDSLCTIETDKASVDFEAQDDGILAQILVSPGKDVPIGTPIGIVTENVHDVPAFANYIVPTTTTATTTAPAVETPSTTTTSTTVSANSILFPSARHLAESMGKDATILVGSGKGGRVTKSDVQIALSQNALPDLVIPASTKVTATLPPATAAAITTMAAVAAPPIMVVQGPGVPMVDISVPEVTGQSQYEDVPNNKMRKIIASRLTASKRTVPHCYVSMEVALDDIMTFRKTLQTQHGIKISVNDCIIRACALALRDVPQVNHTYDTKTETIVTNTNIDVSVAVATPTGLITPIVFRTDQLGLYEITNQVKDLATRARDGQLQPHEYQGGTFSISNLGMFGINEFSAVINPPQAAILAVGGGTPTMVPIASNTYYNETTDTEGADATKTTTSTTTTTEPLYTIQNIMTARLSADRRVVDEATASLFLQVFRQYMQTPELLLL